MGIPVFIISKSPNFSVSYLARISANSAFVTRARSCGFSRMLVPMRPPLTYISSYCSAVASMTDEFPL